MPAFLEMPQGRQVGACWHPNLQISPRYGNGLLDQIAEALDVVTHESNRGFVLQLAVFTEQGV